MRPSVEYFGNVLFHIAHNTFYLRLYGIKHMIKDRSDSKRGNLLLPHVLLFPISSKVACICMHTLYVCTYIVMTVNIKFLSDCLFYC